jgi:hypothetical protein
MSIYTDGTASNWAENTGTPPYIAFPISIALWFKRIADVAGTLMVLGESATSLESFELGVTTTGAVTAKASDASAGTSATSIDADDINVWHHACGVWISPTERYAYIDGVQSPVSAVSRNPVAALSAPALRIGAKLDGSIRLNGLTGHSAVWSVALEPAEVALLAAGANPETVQGSAIRPYYPADVIGTVTDDATGTYDLTFSDTAAFNADNPPVNPATAALALKLFAHSSAVSATGVAGAVYEVPAGGDIFGPKIGEFTGQTFGATLEGGKAVLLVPVSAFGGDALTIADTPVVFARNTDFHTDATPCTVVEP